MLQNSLHYTVQLDSDSMHIYKANIKAKKWKVAQGA